MVPIRSSTQQQGEIKLPPKGTIRPQGSQLAEQMIQAEKIDEDYLHSQSYSPSTPSTKPKDDVRVAKKLREKAPLPSTSSKSRSEQQRPQPTGILKDRNMRELEEENRLFEEMLGGIDLTASTPSSQLSEVKIKLPPRGSIRPQGTATGMRMIQEENTDELFLYTQTTSSPPHPQPDTLAIESAPSNPSSNNLPPEKRWWEKLTTIFK